MHSGPESTKCEQNYLGNVNDSKYIKIGVFGDEEFKSEVKT
jgi:hypothetical protein